MFKVGDIVKIKDGLIVGEKYGSIIYLTVMDEHKGKELEIIKVDYDEYLIDMSSNKIWVAEEMLIPLSKVEDYEIPIVGEENDGNVVHHSHYNKEIESACDAIKPNHYNAGKFDVIWFCQYHNLPFDIGNIIKYAFRAGKKDKNKEVQDLEKAIEYANRRIEFIKGE